MNDFFLYEQLCALEGVGKLYPAGQEFAARARAMADRVVSQVYRVAVVGEFKKGKSSLINALLGSSVLPTDILPMTAAINRVVYGEKERIVVQYKDGRSEEHSVAELQDFATKLDAQKEAVARTVREIQVYYPSVFCKNHIEVLDTPGLNDTEEMAEVMRGILETVDAAIFVLSVTSPMSMTEQALIPVLIGQPGIRHVIFVVTHIDLVKSPEDLDRVIGVIRERVAQNALEDALARYDGDPELMEKSRRILAEPQIYGVSSLLALKGFVRDDEEMLEESRFPEFKDRLLAYLTAAQSADLEAITVEAAAEAARSLEGWHAEKERGLTGRAAELESALSAHKDYVATAQVQLTRLFQKTDLALGRRGIFPEGAFSGVRVEARKPFIARLSRLRVQDTAFEDVLRALQEGKEAAEAAMAGACRSLEGWIREETDRAGAEFGRLREGAGYMPSAFRARMEQWREQTPFPQFQWAEDPIPTGDLMSIEVMPQVNRAIGASLDRLDKEVGDYIASWRLALMRQAAEDRADEALEAGMAEEQKRCRSALSALEVDYGRHRRQVEEIQAKLGQKG